MYLGLKANKGQRKESRELHRKKICVGVQKVYDEVGLRSRWSVSQSVSQLDSAVSRIDMPVSGVAAPELRTRYVSSSSQRSKKQGSEYVYRYVG